MRGGTRAGAGRKKGNKHTVTFWLTDAEEAALKNYLEEMRIPKQHKAPTLDELEKQGQTTIYDYCAADTKPEPPNIPTQKTCADTFNDWKWKFIPNLKAKKKQSKKSAGRLVSEQLSNVYNQLIDNPIDELASQKRSFLEYEARQLLDLRKHINPDEDTLTVFMNNNGYYLTNDDDFRNRHWHYYPLLVKA